MSLKTGVHRPGTIVRPYTDTVVNQVVSAAHFTFVIFFGGKCQRERLRKALSRTRCSDLATVKCLFIVTLQKISRKGSILGHGYYREFQLHQCKESHIGRL